MPKNDKSNAESDIQQLNFFSDENAEDGEVSYTEGESASENDTETVSETDDMPYDSDASFIIESAVVESEEQPESTEEKSDISSTASENASAESDQHIAEDSTEILESELMPEDSVEAAQLTPDTPLTLGKPRKRGGYGAAFRKDKAGKKASHTRKP